MKQNRTIAAVGVAAGLLVLVTLLLNPFGLTDRVREQYRQVTATGAAAPAEPAPAAAAPAAEPQASEPPLLEISDESQQLIGVRSVPVAVRQLSTTIRTVGRVEYDERLLKTVNTKFEGWIERLYVDYTGREVRKGEAMADLYSPELLATQKEFLQLVKWSREAKSERPGVVDQMVSRDADALVAAARERAWDWDISEAQIRKVEETGKPIRNLTIYSPVDGTVVQKMAVQGMKVMPGEKLFDVAELSTLWIIADIYESDLPLIRPAEQAVIALAAYPGKEYRSRIEFISPTLSQDTRTAKVRFTIPNPGEKLKPQMFTDVEIRISMGRKLTVPDDAVIDTGVRQVVYVDKGEGNFEPREVMLGPRYEGFREVLRGLKAGEKVASAAAFLVDSEAQLRGVKPLTGQK